MSKLVQISESNGFNLIIYDHEEKASDEIRGLVLSSYITGLQTLL